MNKYREAEEKRQERQEETENGWEKTGKVTVV